MKIKKNTLKNEKLKTVEQKILHAPIDFKHDEKKALDWGNEKYGDWYDALSQAQKKAILQYSKREWEIINQFLTINDEQKFQQQYPDVDIEAKKELIKLVESALDSIKTTEAIIVYRRIPEHFISENILPLRDGNLQTINLENFNHLRDNFSNHIFTNYGFMSTSLTSNLKNFSTQHRKLPILMAIEIPEGTNAGFLAGWQFQNEERELLVQHGYDFKFLQFKITEEKETGKEIVKAQVELIKKR